MQKNNEMRNQDLTFEKWVDQDINQNFVVYVYQEAFRLENNYLVILDVETCEILKKLPVNPDA